MRSILCPAQCVISCSVWPGAMNPNSMAVPSVLKAKYPLVQVVTALAQHSLVRAFRAWQATASRQQHLAGVLALAAQQWQSYILRSAYREWREWAAETKWEKERLQVSDYA